MRKWFVLPRLRVVHESRPKPHRYEVFFVVEATRPFLGHFSRRSWEGPNGWESASSLALYPTVLEVAERVQSLKQWNEAWWHTGPRVQAVWPWEVKSWKPIALRLAFAFNLPSEVAEAIQVQAQA